MKRTERANKFYNLVMLPYSSGNLHIGHWYNFAPADIYSRFKKMQGLKVFAPMGFDSFGLPAENAAIKNKVDPEKWTEDNIAHMKKQLAAIITIYDLAGDVVTSRPEYYKWTQWLFLQFYKNGLAYKAETHANWCPSCQTVLANEQVVDGKCERCNSEVIQKKIKQWMFRIAQYAEELLSGLDKIDWPERTKVSQCNWIGRSTGAKIKFQIRNSKSQINSNDQNSNLQIEVFTTRADTLFGATYLVLAPEHQLVQQLKEQITNWHEVEKYIIVTQKKTEIQRTDLTKEKTGVKLKGVKAVNPINNEEIPIFIADYVLSGYGTGAIMAVPAHDERDFQFAKKFILPIREVIKPKEQKIVLILHGTAGDSQKNWYPWLKKELEKNGYKVIVPDLPDSAKPISEKWLEALDKYKENLNEKSVIIGHSLGAPTALQLLQRINKKVNKVILVAPIHPKMDWSKIEATHNREQAELIKKFSKKDLDWQKIKSLAEEFIIYLSEGDPYIPFEAKNLFIKDLNPVLRLFSDKNHFNEKTANMTEFPEVLLDFESVYTDEGTMVNSGQFDGLSGQEGGKQITEKLKREGRGDFAINYKLRDWIISRQRYWGAPIPIIYCPVCGEVAVPDSDLPVTLPKDVDFTPKGESPLGSSQNFVNVKCPKCGGPAKRETDTLDTFVCSAWYFYRYVDPKNKSEFADQKKIAKLLPVDMYIGGAEHTVMHLLYARFFCKAMLDIGLLPKATFAVREPFLKLRHQGIILGPDKQKMSKSRGNVVDPDELVKKYGTDVVRMYLCFMGPYDQGGPWDPKGINGICRFLEKVKSLTKNQEPKTGKNLGEKILHQTIKKVTEDIEKLSFNTAVAQLMILVNKYSESAIEKDNLEKLLIILSPFAPETTEKLWKKIGNKNSVHNQAWPEFDPNLIKEDEIELVIQVNGKVRDRIRVAADITEKEAREKALALNKIKKWINREPRKIIFVKGKLINIVV